MSCSLNKAINALFIPVLMASSALPFYFYKSINNGIEANLKERKKDAELKSFSIERCEVKNGLLHVKGWAIEPNIENYITTVIIDDGISKRKMLIKSNPRSDIRNKFHAQRKWFYQLSGFSGTLYAKDKKGIKVHVILSSFKGERLSGEYICK